MYRKRNVALLRVKLIIFFIIGIKLLGLVFNLSDKNDERLYDKYGNDIEVHYGEVIDKYKRLPIIRSGVSYHFEVDVNGKRVKFEVLSDIYHDNNVGDYIAVYCCRGKYGASEVAVLRAQSPISVGMEAVLCVLGLFMIVGSIIVFIRLLKKDNRQAYLNGDNSVLHIH